jgi:uncharacterized SAM-binding protein YcdF (DUF218 family)
MQKFDAIMVLGYKPDVHTWQFPAYIYQSLNRALELYHQGVAPYIVVSGDHALKFDNIGVTQPFKEADKMAEYLLGRGCPPEVILKEAISRDTLANYYYLKNQIFLPHNMKNILQVTADFRIPRFKYLCRKVLGPDYHVQFEGIPFNDRITIEKEAFIFQKQQEFFRDMPDGDDSYLQNQFYDSPWYQFWKAREQSKNE